MHQIEDYIINFLARKETSEDVQKLKEWLAQDPANRGELKHLLAIWDTAGIMNTVDSIDPEKAYQRFMFRTGTETETETEQKTTPKGVRKNIVFKTVQRIAAVFIISFSLGITFHYLWTKENTEQLALIENITPLGSTSVIKLPDGSTVSLNAGSTLRYPVNFGKKRREVYMEGEGYFTVAKQGNKPFTVYTSLANINVSGTEFNVKAYNDEKTVETILIKGEIVVENGKAGTSIDNTIKLKPGQKLSVPAPELQMKPVITQLDPDLAEAAVSWKESDWRIEKETLQELAVKLARRYNVNVYVAEELKNQHFTFTIRDESLEQVLHFMQLSAPITYSIEGKDVYIKKISD